MAESRTSSRSWLIGRHVCLIGFIVIGVAAIAVFLYTLFLRINTVATPFASSVLLRNVIKNELIVVSEDGVALRVLPERTHVDDDSRDSPDYLRLRPWETSWETSLLGRSHQGTRLRLSHTWIDGELLFHFSVSGVTPFLRAMLDEDHAAGYRYGIYFMTASGELVLNTPVPLADMMRGRDDNNNVTTLTYYGQEELSRRAYEIISDWSFNWNWGSPVDNENPPAESEEP